MAVQNVSPCVRYVQALSGCVSADVKVKSKKKTGIAPLPEHGIVTTHETILDLTQRHADELTGLKIVTCCFKYTDESVLSALKCQWTMVCAPHARTRRLYPTDAATMQLQQKRPAACMYKLDVTVPGDLCLHGYLPCAQMNG